MHRFTAFLVGLFYPLIVIVAVILLAAVQLRSPNGSTFDSWRLNYNANRLIAQRLQDTQANLRRDRFQNLDSLSFTDLCLKFFDTEGRLKADIDADLLSAYKSARSDNKSFDQVAGDLRCLVKGYTTLQYDKLYYEAKRDDFVNDINENLKALTANTEQYSELIKGKDDFLAIREMENAWYSFIVAVMPYDLMVLLLVMFMGALGGMVRLLRDYGDRDRTNPASNDYFFVPLIGLVVAIGGYVLAKTGLLLLSSSRDEASLSPFMVSLVGIVSGLLAKDVIDRIARQGAKIINDQSQDTPGPADQQAAQ
jgi:hypothetical protein